METGLNGVTCCVTGANGGIGLATVKLFLAQGSTVLAHYNRSKSNLENLGAASSNLRCVQADLRDEAATDRLFDGLKCQLLVVNHAIYENKSAPIRDMSLQQWQSTITANLTSSFLVIRAFLRQLESLSSEEKEKVAIVLIGSTAGKYGEAGHADYAATKSAMQGGLMLSLKNEIVRIAPKARINTVAPGWVATPMAADALGNADIMYQALASTPLRKVATPIDIANQIVLLSSNKLSGHVTGQVLMVEGGMEGRLLNQKQDIDFDTLKAMVA